MGQADAEVAAESYSADMKKTLDSEAYMLRVDDTGTLTYIGKALPGTATSAAKWQIKEVTNATGDTDWADGNTKFDNIWDNRASLSYS